MQIDSYQIRVQASKVGITQELQMDDDVSSVIMGTVIKIEDSTNEDGTIDRCYVIKGQFAECITKERKQIVKSSGKADQIQRRGIDPGRKISTKD